MKSRKKKNETIIMAEMWSQVGTTLAAFMFFRSVYQSIFPQEFHGVMAKYINKVVSYFNPYVTITFPELETEGFQERSKVFGAIERCQGLL